MRKTKNILKLMTAALCALFLTVLFVPDTAAKAADASAPVGKVTNIKQTKANTTGFSLSWTGVLDAQHYEIQISSDNQNFTATENQYAYANEGSIYKLPASGTSYFVRVVPYNGSNYSGKAYGTPSDTFVAVTAPEAAAKMLTHTDSTTNSISASWNAVPGATRYRVEYYRDGFSSVKSQALTTTPSVTLNNLPANSLYRISYVCAQRISPSGFVAEAQPTYMSATYSGHSYTLPVVPGKAAAPTFTNLWLNIKKATIATSKLASADGYEFEAYTAPKKASAAKKLGTASCGNYGYADLDTTLYNKFLKDKTAVKLRVRAYIMLNATQKRYGAWSDWSYAARPLSKLSTFKRVSGKKKLSLKWSKINGADRYVIKLSTNYKSGFKKACTVKKNKATVTKIGKKKLKTNKKYYVMIQVQKKVGKKFVTLCSSTSLMAR